MLVGAADFELATPCTPLIQLLVAGSLKQYYYVSTIIYTSMTETDGTFEFRHQEQNFGFITSKMLKKNPLIGHETLSINPALKNKH